MEETPETKKYYNILKLFAYGTVTDYKNDKEVIGWELNDAESQKLKVPEIYVLGFIFFGLGSKVYGILYTIYDTSRKGPYLFHKRPYGLRQ